MSEYEETKLSIAKEGQWLHSDHIRHLCLLLERQYAENHPSKILVTGDSGTIYKGNDVKNVPMDSLGAVAFIWNPGNYHWTSVYGVVQHEKRTVDMYYCDSYNGSPDKDFVAFVKGFWTKYLWARRNKEAIEGWKIAHYKVPVPKTSVYSQRNGCDCGVYAYAFIRNQLLGLEHRLYLPDHRNLLGLRTRLQREFKASQNKTNNTPLSDMITANPTLAAFKQTIEHHFWGSEHTPGIGGVRMSCILKSASNLPGFSPKYVAVDIMAIRKNKSEKPCKEFVQAYKAFITQHLNEYATFEHLWNARQDNIYWQAFLTTPSAFAAACLLAIENNQELPPVQVDMATNAAFLFPRHLQTLQNIQWTGDNWTWEELTHFVDNARNTLKPAVFQTISLYNKWKLNPATKHATTKTYGPFLATGATTALEAELRNTMTLEEWKQRCIRAIRAFDVNGLNKEWWEKHSKNLKLGVLEHWFWNEGGTLYPVVREATNNDENFNTSLQQFLVRPTTAENLQVALMKLFWQQREVSWHKSFYKHSPTYRDQWRAWASTNEGLEDVKKHYAYLKHQLVESGFWRDANRLRLPKDIIMAKLPFMENLKVRLKGVLEKENPSFQEPVFMDVWKAQNLVQKIIELRLFNASFDKNTDTYWRLSGVSFIERLLGAKMDDNDLETLYRDAKNYMALDAIAWSYGVELPTSIVTREKNIEDIRAAAGNIICDQIHERLALHASILKKQYDALYKEWLEKEGRRLETLTTIMYPQRGEKTAL